jgi:hypothetical protein
MRAMRSRARHARWLAAALAAAVIAAVAGAPPAEARPRKSYALIQFLGGALMPVRDTADERKLGLGVGVRVGYTSKLGIGIALSAQYSPMPVVEPKVADGEEPAVDVIENHLVSAAVVPRFTLGRGAVRLTVGAGGGGLVERTTSREAADGPRSTSSAFAAAAVGELGLETYLWDSGGLVVTGGYLRSFGDREAEIASVLGGLVFTFR